MTIKSYDAIVIGSGQAGVPLAKKLANAGKKVALIEKRWVGGTCVNDGCTPTKTWVASAKAAYMATKSGELGVRVQDFTIDMPLIKKRKDDIVKQARDGNQKVLEKTDNLDLIFGEASFNGVKSIAVKYDTGQDKIILKADLIFINTGTKTYIPDITGLTTIDYLDATRILDLDKVPEHLVILGGNYIGLEFGQMFGRFGSKITIIEKSERIISHEDEDISVDLQKILTNEKIDILTNSQTTAFEKLDKEKIKVTIKKDNHQKTLTCSHVLIAIGRVPQTGTLNLESAGVKMDNKGYIKVNSKLETNVKGIYALGDVKGGPAFTHISYNDYTIVYRNLLKNERCNTNNRLVPYCLFTDPPLGRVGLSETEAKQKGLTIKVAKLPMAQVARAVETGDTRGFMKAVVDPKSKRILGVAILGAEGGEIMSILQMAIEGKITYDRIRYGIFAHPLYAESLNNLFMALED